MIKFILDNGLTLGLLGITIFLLLLGWRLRKIWLKQVAFNLAAVFFAFLIYEIYLDFSQNGKQKHIVINGQAAHSYGDYHPELGYALRKDSMDARVECRKKNKLLYRVEYGLRKGRRMVPKDGIQDTAFAAFMGGSFTFGEGLNDVETLPAQFNRTTGGHFKTLNFGFHGYGPHHALRLMDISEASRTLNSDHRCRLAFYLFIPDHVRRAAGYASWDLNGPRYELRGDSLTSAGQFSGETKNNFTGNRWWRALRDMWQRSAIAHKHFRQEQIDIDPSDVALTASILDALDKAWEDQQAHFLVLLDPSVDDWPRREAFEQALNDRCVESILLSDVLTENGDGLYIPGDGHPTVNYNATLAEYLAKHQVPYLCRQQRNEPWKH